MDQRTGHLLSRCVRQRTLIHGAKSTSGAIAMKVRQAARERKRSRILAEHGGQVASAVQDADDFNDVR